LEIDVQAALSLPASRTPDFPIDGASFKETPSEQKEQVQLRLLCDQYFVAANLNQQGSGVKTVCAW